MSAPGTTPQAGPAAPSVLEGADHVWSTSGRLVAGPLTWAAIGFGADQVLHTGALTAAGAGFGFAASIAYVWYLETRSKPGR